MNYELTADYEFNGEWRHGLSVHNTGKRTQITRIQQIYTDIVESGE